MTVAYSVVTATPFAAAAGAKTVLMAIAPSANGLRLVEFALSMDGVTASAVPALVELVTSTQAGAGTSGVTPTITQIRGRTASATAPTGGSNYTAEPTTLVRHKAFYVPQFMGLIIVQFPLGREPECDASGGTIKGLGIRITTTATVNVVAGMEVEPV